MRDFAQKFYGVSYLELGQYLAYFKAHVTEDYAPAFFQQYFPPSVQQQMKDQNLVYNFSATQPVSLYRVDGNSAEFKVVGKVTIQTQQRFQPEILSTKTEALLVDVRHGEGTGSLVEKVTEVDPGTAAAKGNDLGKSIEGGVNDLKHAVNTVDDGKSALDKAKGFLGL